MPDERDHPGRGVEAAAHEFGGHSRTGHASSVQGEQAGQVQARAAQNSMGFCS